MLRLLADENFNGSIVRGVLFRSPEIDLVRVQDMGLSGADDPVILEVAANEGRVLLTHDQETMPKFAYERTVAGLAMPGIFVADTYISTSLAIEDILLLTECSQDGEWEGQVRFLPL